MCTIWINQTAPLLQMILDYAQIDPLLLPALDNFPSLDIDRESLPAIREVLSQMPAKPKPEGLIEAKEVIRTENPHSMTCTRYVVRTNQSPRFFASCGKHAPGLTVFLGKAM